MASMKTTVDVPDQLVARAKRAGKSGHSLSAVTEDRLSRVLDTPAPRSRHRLSDLSAGNPDSTDPLEKYSWRDLRAMICGHPGTP